MGLVSAFRARVRRGMHRRWWAAFIAAAAAGLYVAGPWLVPMDWIASRLAARISAAMNRTVRIGAAHFEYGAGLIIDDLVMERRPGFGDGPSVRAERIVLPLGSSRWLRPARLAWLACGPATRPLDMLRIERPECYVVAGPGGTLELADLNDRGGGRLPALAYEIEHLRVHFIELAAAPGGALAPHPTQPPQPSSIGPPPRSRSSPSSSLPPQAPQPSSMGPPPTSGSSPPSSLPPQPARASSIGPPAPAAAAGQTFELPWLSCRMEPASGRLLFEGGAGPGQAVEPGGIRVETNLLVPRLRPDVRVQGYAELHWNQVDLGRWPRWFFPLSQVQTMRGRSTGRLKLDIMPALAVHFDLQLQAEQAEVVVRGAAPWAMADGNQLHTRGTWHPASERLELGALHYEVPGRLRIDGLGVPVLRYDPYAEPSMTAALTARLESLGSLQRALADLGGPDLRDLDVEGPGRVDLTVTRGACVETYQVRLDASAGRLVRPGAVNLPAGMPKVLEITGHRDCQAGGRLEALSVEVGETRLSLTGNWPGWLAGADLADLHRMLQEQPGELRLRSQDLTELCSALPALPAAFPDVQAAGPLQLDINLAAAGQAIELRSRLTLDEQGAVRSARLTKLPGTNLFLSAAARVRPEDPGVFMIDMAGEYGRTRLASDGPLTWTLHAAEAGPAAPPFALQTTLRGRLEIAEPADGLALFPGAMEQLQLNDSGTRLDGACRVDLGINAGLSAEAAQMRGSVTLDGGGLDVHVPEIFSKPAGESCRLQLEFAHAGADRSAGMIHAALELDGGRADLAVERSSQRGAAGTIPATERRHTEVELNLPDMQRFLSHWPKLLRCCDPDVWTGAGRGVLRLSQDGEAAHWTAGFEVTSAALHRLQGTGLHQAGDTPLSVSAAGRRLPADAGRSAWSIDRLEGAWGESSVNLSSCRMVFEGIDLPWARVLHEPWARVVEAELNGHLTLQLAGQAAPLAFQPAHFSGRMAAQGKLRYGERAWEVDAAVDLSGARVAWAGGIKPEGAPARLDLSGRFSRDEALGQRRAELRRAQLEAGGATLHISGRVNWPGAGTLAAAGSGELTVEGVVPDLREPAGWWQGAADPALAGAVRGSAEWTGESGQWRLRAADVQLDQFRAALGGLPIDATGRIAGAGRVWELDLDRLQWQGHSAAVSGVIDYRAERPQLTMGLSVDVADPGALRALLHQAARLERTHRWRWLGTEPAPDASPIAEGQLHISAGRLTIEDSWQRLDHALDEVSAALTWNPTQAAWLGHAAFEGGLLEARTLPEGQIELNFEGVYPTAMVQRRLKSAFPGLQAQGLINARIVLPPTRGVSPEARAAARPQPGLAFERPAAGVHGEFTVAGGVLAGKAAPDWVTLVFPYLNLASFRFERMHDWFEIGTDQLIQHHAIFQGTYYHLYADGWSSPKGETHFEIGIDLLAGLDSQYWAESGGGRIPLFTSTTRLDAAGQPLAEDVNYVPLRLVQAVLWGANPLNTAYTALRQRLEEPAEAK